MTKPDLAFLALGDLHLADTIWSGHPQIADDGIHALRELFAQAKLRECRSVVLVGDIFDNTPPNSDQLTMFQEAAADFVADGGILWCLQGNHDKVPRGSTPWYMVAPKRFLPVKHIGDGQPVNIGGLFCVGYDYDIHDGITSDLLELSGRIQMGTQAAPDVLFLHQAFREALGFANAWNCEASSIPAEIPLTVIGDIHAPTDFATPGGRAYYTGASHGRNIDEIRHRPSFLAVYKDRSVERIPFEKARRFDRAYLLPDGAPPAEHHDAMLAWLRARGTDHLPAVLWITCADELQVQARDLVDRLKVGTKDLQTVPVIVLETMPATQVRAESAPATGRPDEVVSPQQALDELVDPAAHPVANQLARDLISVRKKDDLRAIVVQHRDRYAASLG